MKIATASSSHSDGAAAVDAAVTALLARLEGWPSYVLAAASAALDIDQVARRLHMLLPEVPVHGATSCLGAMTDEGFHSAPDGGLALWGVQDPGGCYGVGLAEWSAEAEGSARQAGREAARAAIADAGRPGEVPALLWLSGAPGCEEEVLAGIHDVLGPEVPIAGGSAADNDVAGNWRQFRRERVSASAVLVSAFFPTARVGFAFHSGYRPTGKAGRVRAAGRRTIEDLDGQPAARLYDSWTNGAVADKLEAGGGNVLMQTTFNPLGRRIGTVGGVPQYLLMHPETVTADAGLTLFAEVEEGDEIVLMEGSRASLVSRAGRVVEAALANRSGTVPRPDGDDERVCGALMVYCAGCLLSVESDIGEIVQDVGEVLGGRPFLGAFTFGEQGRFPQVGNRHGNLMISAVVFTR